LIALLIIIGLFYLIFSEHYDHLNAFKNQSTIEVTIIDIHCHYRRSNMKVQHGGASDYVKLLRKECRALKVGDQLHVLIENTDKLYWNQEPTKRVFWVIPFYTLLIAYLIFWHWREKKKPKTSKINIIRPKRR